MKMDRKNISACLLLGISALAASCSEEIVIGSVDESAYSNVNTVSGYIKDVRTGKADNVIELRAESYSTALAFGLNRAPRKGVDVVLQYDAEYAQTYNAERETEFPLYPEELLGLENEGKILVAPDEKLSYEIGMTVTYSDQLEDDKTYILPIKAVSATEGVSIPESSARSVYLVKNFKNQSSTFKGDDAVKTFLFFEVNDTNPLNALEFVLDNEDESLFFDYVVLFAANINYNAEAGRVYVYCNPQVQFLLDHNEEYLQPLRDRGIKVLLGLLGNHDESGLCQLSEIGARDFARELAAICEAYDLDGVNFDDEYSNSPDLDNPLLAPISGAAAARLCYETKKVMPDKDVTVFQYGYFSGMSSIVDDIDASEWCDIVVANYYAAAEPVGNMTLKQCSGYSAELNLNPYQATESTATETVNDGYGYYMMFALYAGETATTNVSKRYTQIDACNNVSIGLYGVPLKDVQYYYPSQTTVRESIDWVKP